MCLCCWCRYLKSTLGNVHLIMKYRKDEAAEHNPDKAVSVCFLLVIDRKVTDVIVSYL